ncbi:MAG: histidine kinase dimerization/phospho-acceptor domain-containing protein [Gallionella sp.]|nr:histidine kinase dimerization/phospho-acceptor domain-containing protein [Gallionella sp.]
MSTHSDIHGKDAAFGEEARHAGLAAGEPQLILPSLEARLNGEFGADESLREFHAKAEDVIPADFWRSLNYFNLYRLALVGFIVFIALAFDAEGLFGAEKGRLFVMTAWFYATAVMLSFIPLHMRWLPFSWQLAVQVCSDIVALTVLAHASGGIQSSVGLLIMVSLAVAGIISRGRDTLFFAALASIAALLEHTFAVWHDEAPVTQYVQVGLLCISYFAVAGLAHKLAKYALVNQKLAQRRGRDLIGMAEANRLVMRDMYDGVLVVDEHGHIMQMNPSAARLLRNTEASAGRLADSFPLLYGQYLLWKNETFSSRDTIQLDGGLQARLRFIGVERDVAQGAVIFLEDMQHVQAEAQQIKLAALGRLTANLAHEVRNPLSAISYATELLQEEPGSVRQERLLQLIRDNTQRINRIVQDVMQLNRRDRAQSETFDLAVLLRVFVDEFVQSERVAPGVLVLQAEQVSTVTFDKGHLRQVLWNLCSNGLHYGKKLPGSLVLLLAVEHGRVILDVHDDGPGISAENQARLFEPFFTTAEQGTGLGLYIARELCEANGAWLEYHESAAHKLGAHFQITFGERRLGKRPEREHGR